MNDEQLASGSAEEKLLALIANREACDAEALAVLFEQLEPADEAFMLGQWHGGRFDGGAEPNPIRWYGKRFNSRTEVDPMLCLNDKDEVYVWDTWGPAQMREVAYGGKVQACLIYDQHPMMDYFRKISDDVVMGLGDIKGRPLDFFFWLERDKP